MILKGDVLMVMEVMMIDIMIMIMKTYYNKSNNVNTNAIIIILV